MVHIPTGSHHYAEVHAAITRRIICEKCECRFHCDLEAAGHGKGYNPLFLAPATAAKEAEEGAYTDAHRKILSEPIRCPNCGWYQQYMVKELKRRRKARSVAVACLIVAGTPYFLVLIDLLQRGDPGGRWRLFDTVYVGSYLAAIVCMSILYRRATHYEPNRNYPSLPPPRRGEPIGIVDELPEQPAAG